MNERIREIANKAGYNDLIYEISKEGLDKFAKSLIEAVLDEVKERAYYTGDRDWSDEVDRPWIQLVFGYGKLHESKNER